MFVDIQALFLDTGIETQTMCLLNPVEKDETANCRAEIYHQDTKAFCPEKPPTKAIKSTIACGKQSCHQCTKDATYTMHRGCTDGIIDMQFVVNKLNSIDQNQSTDQANDDCTHWRYEITASCDTHKSCQHTIEGQRKRRLTILHPCQEQRGRTACHSGQISGQEHMTDGDAVYLTTGSQL